MLKLVGHWMAFVAIVLAVSLGASVCSWFAALLTQSQTITLREQMGLFLKQNQTLLGTMLIMLPIILWDVLKTSHRVAGPVYRFRTELQNFNNGGEMKPVKLREGDFLTDFEVVYNQFVEEVDRRILQSQASPSKTHSFDENQVTTQADAIEVAQQIAATELPANATRS